MGNSCGERPWGGSAIKEGKGHVGEEALHMIVKQLAPIRDGLAYQLIKSALAFMSGTHTL